MLKDYGELVAPTTRIASLRVSLAIAAAQQLHVHQIHVKTTFLNG